jgi:hypothetical protein
MLARMANRGAAWTFRILVTLAALSAFAQPVFAGSFLSGHYGVLSTHAINGQLAAGLTALAVVAAVLMWKPGGGPGRPAAICAGLLVAEIIEIVLGYQRLLVVHIPLGTAIVGGYAVLLLRVWRPAPAAVAR